MTIVLLRRYATESPGNPDRRADVPGLLLGVTMLAAITASFITAGEQGWLAPLPGALLVAGLITGWLFVRAERRHPHPLLPLTLFRSRELSGATGVGMIFNLVLYGTLLCLSLYLQQARHESVLATGLLLLPSSVFVGVGSLASGRLTARLGPRPPMIAGLALAAAGTALLATAGTSTPLALIVAGSLLIGLISLAMPAMVAAVVGAAGPEHAGVASGILNAARQSGGALGVAVLGSLLGHGHALSLHVPLLVATAGYLVAIALAWTTIRAAGNAARMTHGALTQRLPCRGRERGALVARAPLQQTDPARVGRYRLVARLGAGGMGVVYLAETRDGQPVAVKVLRPELADNPEFRTRFGREVTTLTRIQGMCTVRVIEADTEAPKPFLVTEYADGPSLSEYVDARGPLDPADAVRPGHRARRGADRDPRGRDRAPGPQALQRAAHRGRPEGHRLRHRPGAGHDQPDQDGHHGRLGRLHGARTDHGPGRDGGGHLHLGRDGGLRGGRPDAVRDRGVRRHHVPDRARSPGPDRGAAGPAPAGRGRPGQGPAGPAHRAATAGRADELPADRSRRAVRQPDPDRAGPDLAPARDRSRRAPAPVPTGPGPAGPGLTGPGPRSSRRRSALIPVVLTLAFLLAAGGTALGLALAGKPAEPRGLRAAPPRRPAARPRPSSSAATTPTSPAASTTSPASTPVSTPPTTPASTPASTAPASLPVLTVGSYTGMKPTEIAYSGDATNVVTKITWSSWTATGASGQGTSDIDSCNPNCAQAPPSLVPTTVTLSAPVNGRFTKMTETRNGFTSTYTYPDNWPESAS